MLNSIFKKEPVHTFFIRLTVLALLLRFCLAAAYYNFFVMYLKKPLYAFDGEVYSIIGWYIALILKGANVFMLPPSLVPNDFAVVGGLFGTIAGFGGHLPPIFQYGVGVYSYMVGFFYYIFGYTPVLLRFFNGILSVLMAFLAYDIAKRVFNEKTAKISFVIMLLNPSFIMYSISLQRDILINFLILLVISEVLKLTEPEEGRRPVTAVILSAAGLFLLYSIRINSMAVLSVFIIMLVYMKFFSVYKRLAAYLAISIFLIPPFYSKIFKFAYEKWVLMLKYHWGLTFLGGYTFQLLPGHYYAVGDSGEGWLRQGIAAPDLIIATFKGIVAFFAEPSPFSMHKAAHFIALPQMLLWYLLLAFACVGVYKAFKSPTILKSALLVVMLLFTFSIGLSEANAETLIRHRDMIASIYIIFASYGISVLGNSREKEDIR